MEEREKVPQLASEAAENPQLQAAEDLAAASPAGDETAAESSTALVVLPRAAADSRSARRNLHRLLPDQRRVFSRMGLRGRIFSFLLLFCMILLLLLWLFQVAYLDEFFEKIKYQQMRSAYADVVEHLEDGADELSEVVMQTAQSSQICITVYEVKYPAFFSLDNRVLASADMINTCIIHHLGKDGLVQLYKQTRSSGGFYTQRFSVMDNETENSGDEDKTPLIRRLSVPEGRVPDSLILGAIRTGSSGACYFILLNANISPVASLVSVIRMQLVIVSLLMLVLALILSGVISEVLARPIRRLNRQARQLATGNFRCDFDGRGYRETSELAETLNYAAAELARTDKLQQDIVANISHDLRTPLTMISGYAEFMRDFPGEDHSESIQVIIDEVDRLSRLVNDVLDSTRLQNGREEIGIHPFYITHLLRELAGHYQSLTEKDGYIIRFEASRELVALGDEQRIQQVVANLLNNALTHCGSAREITLRQLQLGDTVRIEVADKGPGIAEQDIPHIWERYYHADAPQRSGKGSGLGLSIVKGILELHHAPFGVISEQGHGACFWFELPLDVDLFDDDCEF